MTKEVFCLLYLVPMPWVWPVPHTNQSFLNTWCCLLPYTSLEKLLSLPRKQFYFILLLLCNLINFTGHFKQYNLGEALPSFLRKGVFLQLLSQHHGHSRCFIGSPFHWIVTPSSKAEMTSVCAAPIMMAATQILNKCLLKEWTEGRKADSNKWKYEIMDFESFSFLMPSKPQTPQFPGLHRV